ncbi:MAG: PadR family transcriptional regulator [Spirochaetes bacterium DG_61]|nr:MAG: PadR family transcriptional regulator [Spirochaetes bacterium DG_61]
MPKVNKTKYAILGMLSFAPMSGYDMKKRFDSSVAHFWNENYGHIYPVLKRLEREGLVIKKTEQTEGKPQRKVYSITEKGRGELKKWLLLPAERPLLRIELLLKLFFGNEVPAENLIEKVEEEKAFCERTLETFDQIEEHIERAVKATMLKESIYWLITLRYGKRYYRALREWCEETIKTLEQLQNNP